MTKWIPYKDDWTMWPGESGYPTKEEAISVGSVMFKGKPFSVARKVDFEFRKFQIDDMLDTAEQEVQDNDGEFATDWRSKISKAMEMELRNQVHGVFHRWALKHSLYPYEITDIERVTP